MNYIIIEESKMEMIEERDDRIYEFKAGIFKVLGDVNRIKIIEFLRDGEKCQCEIIPLLNQSQPTVSRHLSLLEDAGLIDSKRERNRTIYRIVDERVFNIIDSLNDELIRRISHRVVSKVSPFH
ncbi:MAG: ArsR/SmtB family transcription factor [Candidatus Bathyarchaeia archaeon]